MFLLSSLLNKIPFSYKLIFTKPLQRLNFNKEREWFLLCVSCSLLQNHSLYRTAHIYFREKTYFKPYSCKPNSLGIFQISDTWLSKLYKLPQYLKYFTFIWKKNTFFQRKVIVFWYYIWQPLLLVGFWVETTQKRVFQLFGKPAWV